MYFLPLTIYDFNPFAEEKQTDGVTPTLLLKQNIFKTKVKITV